MEKNKSAAKWLIDNSDPDFLVCRSIGHQMDEATSRVKRDGRRLRWSMDCARCGMVRTKVLSATGEILGSFYQYPKKYLAPGVGRLDKTEAAKLRMHVITEVL